MAQTNEQPVRDQNIKLRITTAEHDWLKQVALEEDRSVSNVLRLALKQYMETRTR